MVMKRLILVQIVLLSFCSCVYLKMTHLDQDDISWIEVYTPEYSGRFASVEGEIDILLVDTVEIYNSSWPFYFSEASSEYIANAFLSYHIVHCGNIIEGRFYVIKENGNTPALLSFMFCERYANDIVPNLQNVLVGNTIHSDCIVLDESNSINMEKSYKRLPYNIRNLVWSKSKGLLQYTFDDGQVYTRIE